MHANIDVMNSWDVFKENSTPCEYFHIVLKNTFPSVQ